MWVGIRGYRIETDPYAIDIRFYKNVLGELSANYTVLHFNARRHKESGEQGCYVVTVSKTEPQRICRSLDSLGSVRIVNDLNVIINPPGKRDRNFFAILSAPDSGVTDDFECVSPDFGAVL